jgi:arylsulfatase A-like enzyme
MSIKKRYVLASACLVVASTFVLPRGTRPRQRPNILLIDIDDLGWRDLGYMGSHYYETPHIDSLAAQGLIFTDAYAAAANCAPSRASLFSGEWAPRTGVYTVGSSERGSATARRLIPVVNHPYLDAGVLTLAEVLHAHGYATCQVGKWHISKDPLTEGFDVNFGGAWYGHPPHGYFSPWHNVALKDGPPGAYLTDRLTDLAIGFLKRHRTKPFFMNFATYAVHTPLQAKPELVEKYRRKQGSYGQDNPVYAAMIETVDQNVGRLIDCLKRTGAFDHTLIVFTSDNGGVYKITRQWPLRAGKGSYYEGGIRIPLFVVWPHRVKGGTTTAEPVVNTDFFPTFLAAAGIGVPKGKVLDGRSFLPVLSGRRLPPRMLHWYFPVYLEGGNAETTDACFRTRPGESLRSGPWVLQHYFEDGHLELYNLDMDPGERKNLAGLFPARVRMLQDSLTSWRLRVRAPVPHTPNPLYTGACHSRGRAQRKSRRLGADSIQVKTKS